MLLWITLTLVLLILTWIIWSFLVIKSIETPHYDVLEIRKWYELREYKDYIVAQVEIIWEREEAINAWFRILAHYIFWGNAKKQSISMTAPVNDIEQKSVNISMTAPVNDIQTSSNSHLVQFILPSKYTLETLPAPNDARIKIKTVEGYTAAAMRYTLWATDKKIKNYKTQLNNYLKKDNLKIVWKVISAQYNPPLSFPLMRRNEIIAEIR